MRSLFREPGCTCPEVTDVFRAVVEGTELEPCAVHHPEEVKARAAANEREEAEEHLARVRVALDEIRRPPAAPEASRCTCDPGTDLRSLLAGGEAADCMVHRPFASGSAIALNDNQALARIVGAPLAQSEHDAPPDAA